MNNPHQPQEESMLDHEIDGIRELDNLLPRWWVWLFYLTIIFAAIYLVNYHTRWGHGQLMAIEYDKEMKLGDALKTAAMSKFETGIKTLAETPQATWTAKPEEEDEESTTTKRTRRKASSDDEDSAEKKPRRKSA